MKRSNQSAVLLNAQTHADETTTNETIADDITSSGSPTMNGHYQKVQSHQSQTNSHNHDANKGVAEETSPQDGIINERLI